MQYKYHKEESQAPGGAHLNFETYGNLRSAVWRENVPFPEVEGLIRCNVAFGTHTPPLSTQTHIHYASESLI